MHLATSTWPGQRLSSGFLLNVIVPIVNSYFILVYRLLWEFVSCIFTGLFRDPAPALGHQQLATSTTGGTRLGEWFPTGQVSGYYLASH